MYHKQIESLARFIPVNAAEHVAKIIADNNLQLKITNRRLSKLGDFRASANGSKCRITVNSSLNIYAFLLVFLHEFAHLQVWQKYKRSVQPHGKEWKGFFGKLIREHVDSNFFHHSLNELLTEYSFNVKATGLGSPELTRALGLFDNEAEDLGQVFLEELPVKSLFRASNGRQFQKEDRLRKRYRCHCLDNNRKYLFHPMARVFKIENGK